MTTDRSREPLLEIENLSLSYVTRAGEVPAVTGFDLVVWPGESVGLVGESGCGKTTVALGIMRYLGRNGRIVGGRVRFKGRDMADLTAEELRRVRGREIAMIYQEPMAALNPCLTVGRQLVEVPIVHEGASAEEARERSLRMLADVRIADAERVFAAYPHQLSGGQQQRVVIAMALLSNPALLLLDEPTTALDVTVEAGIVELIKEVSRKYGTAQLYISHNMGLVLETCERVCVMYAGEVVKDGAVDDVFRSPRHPYTRGLFDCIPVPSCDKNARPLRAISGQLPLPHERPPGCGFGPRCGFFQAGRCDAGPIALETVGAGPPLHGARCCRWQEIDWTAAVPGAEAQQAAEVGDVVLDVRGMRKYYEIRDRSIRALLSGGGVRQVRANEAIDFRARRSETVAIVGESGCGKSTFAKVLMGLETATAGEIDFAGVDLGKLAVHERTPQQRAALQMVFQNPDDTLNPSRTVGAQIARVIRKFGIESDRARIDARVGELLDLVKLPREFAHRRPRQLSGGQKQRVGIARAFAGNPELVIADEPVSALDVSVQAAVTQLLVDIQREHGTTLLVISHDLSVVRYLADRVVVMYLGQIMERGTTEKVFSPPYHPYTEALLSAVPVADPDVRKREIVLEGDLPSVLEPPKGCPFATRCPRKLGSICDQERPPVQIRDGHAIACHIPLDELKDLAPVMQFGGTAGDRPPAPAE